MADQQERALTPKQLHFARCVASGMSQTEAYREAYNTKPDTKPDSLHQSASRLAKDPRIASRIRALIRAKDRAIADSAVHDRERVLRKLRDIMDAGQGGPAEASQLRAAELLGKSVGLFKDVVLDDDPQPDNPAEIEQELRDLFDRYRETGQEQEPDGSDDGPGPDEPVH